jgi:hypothetical protein
MNASRRAMVLALLALGLGGCPDEPSDPDVARRVIGPGGGLLTSTDDVHTLAIPPGALDEEVELFLQRSDEPPTVFGEAYLVRPNPVLRYDVSVTYRQELPDDTSGLAVGAIDATAFEQGRGHWEPLPLLRVDRQAELVSGLDDGLSIFYGLLNDAEPEPSEGDGETTDTPNPTTGPDPDGDTGTPETTGGADSGRAAAAPARAPARRRSASRATCSRSSRRAAIATSMPRRPSSRSSMRTPTSSTCPRPRRPPSTGWSQERPTTATSGTSSRVPTSPQVARATRCRHPPGGSMRARSRRSRRGSRAAPSRRRACASWGVSRVAHCRAKQPGCAGLALLARLEHHERSSGRSVQRARASDLETALDRIAGAGAIHSRPGTR